MADLLEERADEFARTESRNTGKPLKFSSAFDVPLTIDNLRFFAAAARNLEGKASAEYLEGLTSTIRREPIGVCASIVPWNYPLNMAAWKLGPALAAGNTVVLKPAELTPLTALMLGRLGLEAGLPPGVLNVIPGPGPEVGGVLARHQDVALISVTGSTRTGASVMREAAGTVKRVHMELGGKAPFVVFEDADLEAAAEGAIVRRVRQLRPGLHRRHPHLRPRPDPRRLLGASPAQGRPARGRRSDGRSHQPRAARLVATA